MKQEIHDAIEYRVSRALNEVVDDEEWFVECGTNDILSIIKSAIEQKIKELPQDWNGASAAKWAYEQILSLLN